MEAINNDPEKIKVRSEKSKATKAARKTLKKELIDLLESNNYNERISTALIKRALKGDVQAFIAIRDTIGEKPVTTIEADVSNKVIKVELEKEND